MKLPKPPFLDLAELRPADLRGEIVAALAVTLMSVPQGIAYAMIAGLPPAMGLYAGAVPAVVGSLLRSSRHVVVGPTNALSLIIATSAAAKMDDPAAAAATIALVVGVLQIGAGLLRLGGLVDYISTAVVTGYITGAATLIAVGQLPGVTRTDASSGTIFGRLAGWVSDLPHTHLLSLGIAVGSVVTIIWLRRYLPRGVPALIAMVVSTGSAWVFGLDGHGLRLVRDLSPVPAGLPPFSIPSLSGTLELGSVAIAAMVLSLVESSSVSRAIAARSGQRIDSAIDFVGLGAANVAAALFGAYPVSGSLSRSALNFQVGAKTRLAGILSGVAIVLVLLGLGPVVDWTPIAALAGLILVVAVDLVDVTTIRHLLASGPTDRFAFLGTVLGTWVLPLDQAIYVGVGISLVLFLRRARLLVIRELWVDSDLHLHEVESEIEPPAGVSRCDVVRILHVEGPLFFGAASELEQALDERIADPKVQVLIVRLKRAIGIDYTAGQVLAQAHDKMKSQGRHLMLVGMREDMMRRLEDIGVADNFETMELYPTEPGWFVAMNHALAHALELVDQDRAAHSCHDCPLVRYVSHREATPRVAR